MGTLAVVVNTHPKKIQFMKLLVERGKTKGLRVGLVLFWA